MRTLATEGQPWDCASAEVWS